MARPPSAGNARVATPDSLEAAQPLEFSIQGSFYKLCKKTAQLTKLIAVLVNRAEEVDYEKKALRDAYQAELDRLVTEGVGGGGSGAAASDTGEKGLELALENMKEQQELEKRKALQAFTEFKTKVKVREQELFERFGDAVEQMQSELVLMSDQFAKNSNHFEAVVGRLKSEKFPQTTVHGFTGGDAEFQQMIKQEYETKLGEIERKKKIEVQKFIEAENVKHRTNLEAVHKEYKAQLDRKQTQENIYQHTIQDLQRRIRDLEIMVAKKEKEMHDKEEKLMGTANLNEERAIRRAEMLEAELKFIQDKIERAIDEKSRELEVEAAKLESRRSIEHQEKMRQLEVQHNARTTMVEQKTRQELHHFFMKFQAQFAEKEKDFAKTTSLREDQFQQIETSLRQQLTEKHDQMLTLREQYESDFEKATETMRMDLEKAVAEAAAARSEATKSKMELDASVGEMNELKNRFTREMEKLMRDSDETQSRLEGHNSELVRRVNMLEGANIRAEELEMQNRVLSRRLTDIEDVYRAERDKIRRDADDKVRSMRLEVEEAKDKFEKQRAEDSRLFDLQMRDLEMSRNQEVLAATKAFEVWKATILKDAQLQVEEQCRKYARDYICPECQTASNLVQRRDDDITNMLTREREYLERLRMDQVQKITEEAERVQTELKNTIQAMERKHNREMEQQKMLTQDNLQAALTTFEEAMKNKDSQYEASKRTWAKEFLSSYSCPDCAMRRTSARLDPLEDEAVKMALAEAERSVEQSRAEAAAVEKTVGEMKLQHQAALSEALKRYDDLAAANEERHANDIRALEERHKEAMLEAEREMETKIQNEVDSRLQHHPCAECAELKRLMDLKTKDVLEIVDAERLRLHSSHSIEIARIRAEYNAEKDKHAVAMARLEKKHAEELAANNEHHQNALSIHFKTADAMISEQRQSEQARLEVARKKWALEYVCPECERVVQAKIDRENDTIVAVEEERRRLQALHTEEVEALKKELRETQKNLKEGMDVMRVEYELKMRAEEREHHATVNKAQLMYSDALAKREDETKMKIEQLMEEIRILQNCPKCQEERDRSKLRLDEMETIHQKSLEHQQEVSSRELEAAKYAAEAEATKLKEEAQRVADIHDAEMKKMEEKHQELFTKMENFGEILKVRTAESYTRGHDDGSVEAIFQPCQQCDRYRELWQLEKTRAESAEKKLSNLDLGDKERARKITEAELNPTVLVQKNKELEQQLQQERQNAVIALSNQHQDHQRTIEELKENHGKEVTKIVEKFGKVIDSKSVAADAERKREAEDWSKKYSDAMEVVQSTVHQARAAIEAAAKTGTNDEAISDAAETALLSSKMHELQNVIMKKKKQIKGSSHNSNEDEFHSNGSSASSMTPGAGTGTAGADILDATTISLLDEVCFLFSAVSRRMSEQMQARVRSEDRLKSLMSEEKRQAINLARSEQKKKAARKGESDNIQHRSEIEAMQRDFEAQLKQQKQMNEYLSENVQKLSNQLVGLQSQVTEYSGYEQMSRDFERRAQDALVLLEKERTRLTTAWQTEVATLKRDMEEAEVKFAAELQHQREEHEVVLHNLEEANDAKASSTISGYEALLHRRLEAASKEREEELKKIEEKHRKEFDEFQAKWEEEARLIEEKYGKQQQHGGAADDEERIPDSNLFLESASLEDNIARIKARIMREYQGKGADNTEDEDGAEKPKKMKKRDNNRANGKTKENIQGDGEGDADADADANADDSGSNFTSTTTATTITVAIAPQRDPMSRPNEGSIADAPNKDMVRLLSDATQRLDRRLAERERDMQTAHMRSQRDFLQVLDLLQTAANEKIQNSEEMFKVKSRQLVQEVRDDLEAKVFALKKTESSMRNTVSELQSKIVNMQTEHGQKRKDHHQKYHELQQKADKDYAELSQKIQEVVEQLQKEREESKLVLERQKLESDEILVQAVAAKDEEWSLRMQQALQEEKERHLEHEQVTKLQMNDLLSTLQKQYANLKESCEQQLANKDEDVREQINSLTELNNRQRNSFEEESKRVAAVYAQEKKRLERELDDSEQVSERRRIQIEELLIQCDALAKSNQEQRLQFIKEVDIDLKSRQEVEKARQEYLTQLEAKLQGMAALEEKVRAQDLEIKAKSDEMKEALQQADREHQQQVQRFENEIARVRVAFDRTVLNTEQEKAVLEARQKEQLETMDNSNKRVINELVDKYEGMLARKDEDNDAARARELGDANARFERDLEIQRRNFEEKHAADIDRLERTIGDKCREFERELERAKAALEREKEEGERKTKQIEFMSLQATRTQAEFMQQTRDKEKATEERIEEITRTLNASKEELLQRKTQEYSVLLEDFNRNIAALTDEANALRSQIVTKDKENSGQGEKILELEGVIRLKDEEIGHQEKRFSDLQHNVELLKIEYMGTIKTKEQKAAEELAVVKETFQQKLDQAKEDTQEMQHRLTEMAKLAREEFDRRLQKNELEIAGLREEIRTEAAARAVLEDSEKQLQHENGVLSKDLAMVTAAREEDRLRFEAELEERQRRKDEEMFLQISKHEDEMRALVARHSSLYEQLEAEHKRTSEELLERVHMQEQDNAKLIGKVESSREVIGNLETKIQAMRAELEQKDKLLVQSEQDQLTVKAHAKKEVNVIENDLRRKHDETVRLHHEEKMAYQKRAEELYNGLRDELRRTTDKLSEDLRQAADRERDCREAIAGQLGEIKRLQERVDLDEAEKMNLLEEAEQHQLDFEKFKLSCVKEMHALTSQHHEAIARTKEEGEIARQQAVQEGDARVRAVELELERQKLAMQRVIDDMSAEAKGFAKQQVDQQADLDRTRDRLAEREKELEEIQKEVISLRRTTEGLTAEFIAQSEAASNRFREELEAMRDHFNAEREDARKKASAVTQELQDALQVANAARRNAEESRDCALNGLSAIQEIRAQLEAEKSELQRLLEQEKVERDRDLKAAEQSAEETKRRAIEAMEMFRDTAAKEKQSLLIAAAAEREKMQKNMDEMLQTAADEFSVTKHTLEAQVWELEARVRIAEAGSTEHKDRGDLLEKELEESQAQCNELIEKMHDITTKQADREEKMRLELESRQTEEYNRVAKEYEQRLEKMQQHENNLKIAALEELEAKHVEYCDQLKTAFRMAATQSATEAAEKISKAQKEATDAQRKIAELQGQINKMSLDAKKNNEDKELLQANLERTKMEVIRHLDQHELQTIQRIEAAIKSKDLEHLQFKQQAEAAFAQAQAHFQKTKEAMEVRIEDLEFRVAHTPDYAGQVVKLQNMLSKRDQQVTGMTQELIELRKELEVAKEK